MVSSPPARSDASHPFQSALLLTDLNTNAAVDRAVLRAAGVRQVRVATSGVDSARYLADRVSRVLPPSTELVVCLPALADMDAADFAALARLHPLLEFMPLLAIIAGRGQEIPLKQAGFNAVLVRPFTVLMLQEILAYMGREARATRAALIATLRRRGMVPSHEAFDRRLEEYAPPDRAALSAEECLRQGQEWLRERRGDEALPFLHKAAADVSTQADACLALAALWKERGEKGKIRSCLLSALQGFLESGAWAKAGVLTRRLLAEYPDLPNPLLRELERRVRAGRADGLPDLTGLALDFVSQDQLIATLLGGCEAAPDAGAALDRLLEALTGEEWSALAKALARAAGRDAEPSARHGGWLRRAFGLARRSPSPDGQDGAEETKVAPAGDAGAGSVLRHRDGATPDDSPSGGLIALLGQDTDDLRPSRLSGSLGDALTVIRGTRRLYRSVK